MMLIFVFIATMWYFKSYAKRSQLDQTTDLVVMTKFEATAVGHVMDFDSYLKLGFKRNKSEVLKSIICDYWCKCV